MQQFDLIFIRHGESKINQATRAIAEKYGISNTYNYLKNYPEWTQDVKYSMNFVDCPLSEIGKEQCMKARKKADQLHPDVILVSPLQRALQTCNYLFGNRGIPIIVQPILTESIRSSCDLSSEIKPKTQRFPQFNFGSVLKQQQFWQIKYDEQNSQKYLQKIHEASATTIPQKNQAILSYMSQTSCFQTPKNVRNRIKKIKQLLQSYKQKYGVICVVAHFNIINYTVAKEFDEGDQPKNSIKIHNCQFCYCCVGEILKYS